MRFPRAREVLVLCGGIVGAAAIVVLVSLAVDVVKGGSSKGAWPFLAAVVAAAATLVGAFFTREQQARAEERFRLDTAVSGLKLLTAGDGSEYAPQGVVAGALATLLHLGHPVIAMRVLAACWEDNAVDVRSATWLISEIFSSEGLRRAGSPSAAGRAQNEAAALLDVHSRELCHDTPGRLSWPSAISDQWIPEAPLTARLRALRAALDTFTSREAAWWAGGGRLGWSTGVLHRALICDSDNSVKAEAGRALRILLPILASYGLSDVQALDSWLPVAVIETDATSAPMLDGEVALLRGSFQRLYAWAEKNEGTAGR